MDYTSLLTCNIFEPAISDPWKARMAGHKQHILAAASAGYTCSGTTSEIGMKRDLEYSSSQPEAAQLNTAG
jgi:hypothetical protein